MTDLNIQQCLIHIMVVVSAVDRNMRDEELASIGDAIKTLPVFEEYNPDNLIMDSQVCREILQQDDGLETIISNALELLPEHLYETAYALAVEVAVSDLAVMAEEARLLQILRQRFRIDRLKSGAIEYSALARNRRA